MANNGFGFEKSLSEQINDICKSKMNRKDKVNALIKLGLRENEVAVILPAVRASENHRFVFTFGVEIECIMRRCIFEASARIAGVPYHYESYNHTDNREYFKFVTDGSLSRTAGREGDPIECVSPVLSGNKSGFDKLALCCASLNEADAYVNKSTGLHVHIGAENLTDEQYVNVFKNYKALEAVIDTFMPESRRDNYYCRGLRDHNFNHCEDHNDVLREMGGDRYHKVNPCSYNRHHTIEFRQHSGTTNFAKIKNWVNFCAKLVAYSTKNVITGRVTSIDDIPFLNATEKAFFKGRKAALEGNREREVA